MGTFRNEPAGAAGRERQIGTDSTAGAATMRRGLVVGAVVLAVVAASHLADHAIRGEIVVDHDLNPEWDHSGWPFTDDVTPFTMSLAIPVVFAVAAVLTRRGHLSARFWLVWTSIAAAVVVFVHFVPGSRTETLGVIYRTYDRGIDNPAAGVLAAAVVLVIVGGLATLIVLALRAQRLSRRR